MATPVIINGNANLVIVAENITSIIKTQTMTRYRVVVHFREDYKYLDFATEVERDSVFDQLFAIIEAGGTPPAPLLPPLFIGGNF